jgi:hypothetical protein
MRFAPQVMRYHGKGLVDRLRKVFLYAFNFFTDPDLFADMQHRKHGGQFLQCHPAGVFCANSGMVQKRPILGNTDNSNPTRILRVSIG